MEELEDFTDRNYNPRIADLGMNMSHRWVSYNGDCWAGVHCHVLCYNCLVEPFRECIHELPKSRVSIDIAAFQPCPKGSNAD